MFPEGVSREKFHSLGNFCPCQPEVLWHVLAQSRWQLWSDYRSTNPSVYWSHYIHEFSVM